MALVMVVPEREELESEVSLKSMAQFTPLPYVDNLSLFHRAQVARMQLEFSDVFTSTWSHCLHRAPH